MVSRLQDTVEQLQGQLQVQIRDATEQQRRQLTKLSDSLEKQEECMFHLFATIASVDNT